MERAKDFVWKYETPFGSSVGILVDGDPGIVVNLTVWRPLSSIKRFVWKTLRKKIY